MARKEMVICDAIFLDGTTRRAVQVGISPRVVRALEKTLTKQDGRTCNTLLYRGEPGEPQQRINFTDVLVVDVSGPGHKPPEEFVI